MPVEINAHIFYRKFKARQIYLINDYKLKFDG